MKAKRHFNFYLPTLLMLAVLFSCMVTYAVVGKEGEKPFSVVAEIVVEEEIFRDLSITDVVHVLSVVMILVCSSESVVDSCFLSSVSTFVQVGWRMPLRI